MPRGQRTFVAFDLSPEVCARGAELIRLLKQADAPVSWVAPHQFHVTLKFLGDVDVLDTVEICAAVSAAVASLPPFDYEVRGAGAFPDPHRPRTIWLGITADGDALQKLYAAVDQCLTNLGFRGDVRRYQPHVTLGRVKGTDPESFARLAALLAEHHDFFGGAGDVAEVVVYASTLERSGPSYQPLARADLGGR